tara:strand:+ start:6213 stop:6401 length:189 start_codon:yes stop_codon:yes gene_type:complete
MLELFDNVHDLLHMIRNMADGLYEAAADVENSLLEALKCLDPDPPNMDNVVLFPTEKVSDET